MKLLVLYHSMYGHIETMAQQVAEGARSVPGVEVTLKRVPETMAPEAFKAAGGKTEQSAPVATPAELGDYDAIILAHLPVSVICPARCATSSTRLVVCGQKAHW